MPNETENERSSRNDQTDSNETLEITLNKETDEVFLKNLHDSSVVKLNAKFRDILEEKLEEFKQEKKESRNPLTPEEIEDGIKKLDDLGLTFSVDLFPSIISKDESNSDLIDSDDFDSIREKYPALPGEVGLIAHNTLTGEERGVEMLGGKDSYNKKRKIVNDLVLTSKYKTDFFFKHSLKVPYLENIDWEVVLKTHERGVKGVVSVPYAMLMLTFHNTNPKIGDLDVHKNITVAANREIIDTMLGTLTEIRASLNESSDLANLLLTEYKI